MAQIVPTQISNAGTPSSFVQAAAGDTIVNNGNTILHIKNSNGVGILVTVNSIKACDQGFDHDLSIAVAAGQEQVVGPFPIVRFGRNVALSYSGTSGVTIAAYSV